MNANNNKSTNKKKIKKERFSLSKKLNTTSEDLAMLQDRRKDSIKDKGNLCDRHMDGA